LDDVMSAYRCDADMRSDLADVCKLPETARTEAYGRYRKGRTASELCL
jgi:hypothetical protein